MGYYMDEGQIAKPVSTTPKYTKIELLTKDMDELKRILKSLGVTRIPKKQIERVDKILELTGG